MWPVRHSHETEREKHQKIAETLTRILRFNALVTVLVQGFEKAQSEMTTVKAALLSLAMFSAIVLGGLGIYAADAANDHNAVDGYGVTASLR